MSAPEPAPRRTRIRVLRPFTTHVFNPISRRFVQWLPGFAILIYRGRKSGKTYRTPINLFRDGDAYVFALTYGSDVQWVRNVVAAGEADALIRRHMIHLTHPELFVDPSRRSVPFPVRQFLGFMRVSEFLRLHVAPDPAIALDGLRDRGVD
jgi:deazaflavin-dependent oxidoreductase (nitroreductase family)